MQGVRLSSRLQPWLPGSDCFLDFTWIQSAGLQCAPTLNFLRFACESRAAQGILFLHPGRPGRTRCCQALDKGSYRACGFSALAHVSAAPKNKVKLRRKGKGEAAFGGEGNRRFPCESPIFRVANRAMSASHGQAMALDRIRIGSNSAAKPDSSHPGIAAGGRDYLLATELHRLHLHSKECRLRNG